MEDVTDLSHEAAEHRRKAQKHKEVFEKKLAAAKKEKGLLIVYTGTGKGKSTAAFGMGVRILAHGMKLGVVQFIKGALDTGERRFLSDHERCSFQTIGEGYTWNVQDLDRDKQTARKGWDIAVSMIESGEFDMVILDELNIVLKHNYLAVSDVLDVLARRDPNVHVVITGRHAPEELITAADLVTEMKVIKHPYKEQGVKAQRGVEF